MKLLKSAAHRKLISLGNNNSD